MPLTSGILIEVSDFITWEPLKQSPKFSRFIATLPPEERTFLEEDFANYILNFYKSLLQNAIHQQRFPGRPYQPLSMQYAIRKRQQGQLSGFWRATGFLVNNLRFWKTTSGKYYIGLPDVRHPNSGTPIRQILSSLELGSPARNIPPRPLFVPLARGISKHIYDTHFKRFIKDKHPQHLDKL